MFSRTIDDELKLVLPLPHHDEAILKLVRENLEILKVWMPWATDEYSINSAREFIHNSSKQLLEGGGFNGIISFQNEFVGVIGFNRYDAANKSVEIGYWLATRAQGRGIVTKCCRAFIDYAFDDWSLNRIQINCNTENLKSRAVPERLGFKLEGIRRQAEFFNNRYGDWAIYAMLKEEWSEQ
jgi:ribosomal-protein-serine acetyltransferase